MSFRAISLFSNCGAGDLGYALAGFKFDVMAELEPDRLALALLNHPRAIGISGDLRTTLPQVITAWRDRRGSLEPDLLAACPPCQGMSTVRSGRGRESDPDAGSRDSRNLLVEVIARAAKELSPRIIVVENVRAFLTRQVRDPETNDPVSAAVLLARRLSADYAIYPAVIEMADYGVPQYRQRAFLTFIRRDELGASYLSTERRAPYPAPSHKSTHISIKQALTEAEFPALDALSSYTARDPDLHMHAVPVWDERRYAMIASIPADSGRTAWQNDICARCKRVSTDTEAAVCESCGTPLPRPVIRSGGEFRLISGFRRSSYARIRPETPSNTITTASGRIGGSNTIHPWENRVLSPRECAHLQTFPDTYQWGEAYEQKGDTFVRAVIGEAVPPLFTRSHGRVLASLLHGRRTRNTLSLDAKAVSSPISTLRQLGFDTDPCTREGADF